MGKVRRNQQKFHKTQGNSKATRKSQTSNIDTPKLIPAMENVNAEEKLSENVFAGFKVSIEDSRGPVKNTKKMKSSLATQSKAIRKKAAVGTVIGTKYKKIKSARQKKKHQELMKKIGTVQAVKQADEARKKREKTKVVGDLHPMLNALPSLEELLENTKKQNEISNIKPKNKKLREKHKALMTDYQLMMAVNKDKLYNDDPFGCIAKAVHNRILYDQEEMQQM